MRPPVSTSSEVCARVRWSIGICSVPIMLVVIALCRLGVAIAILIVGARKSGFSTVEVLQACFAVHVLTWQRALDLLIVVVLAAFLPMVMRFFCEVRMRRDNRWREKDRKTRRRSIILKKKFSSWSLYSLLLVIAVTLVVVTRVEAKPMAAFILMQACVPGLVLFISAFSTRQGYGLSCAKCGYAVGSWRRAASICPECGNEWKKPWKVVWGRRQFSWSLAAMGVVCLLLSVYGLLTLSNSL